MKWRHLITIVFVAAVFFSTVGLAFGDNENDEALPTSVAEPVLTLEEKARFQQVVKVLNKSATGSHLLGLKEAYKIKVRYASGQGSSFMQAANRIRLEADFAPVKAALIFAHEMNHAQAFHEGNKAHRKSDSRQAYVQKMLWEESEGMAVSIQVKMELERNGVDVADIALPLEDDYRHAYQEAVEQARRTAPTTSARQLDAVGKAAGVQALYDAHLRGETSTSNTHETVLSYYGRMWDEVHPVKAFMASLVG